MVESGDQIADVDRELVVGGVFGKVEQDGHDNAQQFTDPLVRLDSTDLHRSVDGDVSGEQRVTNGGMCGQEAGEFAVDAGGAGRTVEGGSQVADHRAVGVGEQAALFDHADQDRSFSGQSAELQLVGAQTLIEYRLGQCHGVFDEGFEDVAIVSNVCSDNNTYEGDKA